ncbi:hypothetical protein RI367_004262 [Sorochytrium milnesiophthora]
MPSASANDLLKTSKLATRPAPQARSTRHMDDVHTSIDSFTQSLSDVSGDFVKSQLALGQSPDNIKTSKDITLDLQTELYLLSLEQQRQRRGGWLEPILAYVELLDNTPWGPPFGAMSRLSVGIVVVISILYGATVYSTCQFMVQYWKDCTLLESAQSDPGNNCRQKDVIFAILLVGLLKELLKILAVFYVLYHTKTHDRSFGWCYAFIANSWWLLPLVLLSGAHRNKVIKQNAIARLTHPTLITSELLLTSGPLNYNTVYTSAQNLGNLSPFNWIALIVTCLGILYQLVQFSWIALSSLNEYGKRQQRILDRKEATRAWFSKLQKCALVVGPQDCKKIFLEHLKVKLNEHLGNQPQDVLMGIMEKRRELFRSIMEMAPILLLRILLQQQPLSHLEQDAAWPGILSEFRQLGVTHKAQIRALQRQSLWSIAVDGKLLFTMQTLWACKYMQMLYRDLSSTNKHAWMQQRYADINKVDAFMELDKKLLAMPLEYGAYCLNKASEIYQPGFRPTREDVMAAPGSLIESFFVQWCDSIPHHIPVSRQDVMCFLDTSIVPSHFKRLKRMSLLADFLVILADMGTFDQFQVVRDKASGKFAKTTPLRDFIELFEHNLSSVIINSRVIIVWINFKTFQQKLEPARLGAIEKELLECYPSLRKFAKTPMTASCVRRYFEQKFRKLDPVIKRERRSPVTDRSGLDKCIEMLLAEMRMRLLTNMLAEVHFI